MQRWEESGNPWTVRSVTRPFENAWFAIDAHDTLNPAGNPASYAVIRIRRRAVGVLPIDGKGHVHMVGQCGVFRSGAIRGRCRKAAQSQAKTPPIARGAN